jgi:hypothetical protein
MARLFGKYDPVATVEGALKKRSWKYGKPDGESIITGVATASGHNCFISIRHVGDRKTVVFLFNPTTGMADALLAVTTGRLPFFRVHQAAGHSEDQVRNVCEILVNENYRIMLGDFERDHNDGEIRFRIALPYQDGELTADQVNWCIDIAVTTVDLVTMKIERYLKGEIQFEEAVGDGSGRMVV